MTRRRSPAALATPGAARTLGLLGALATAAAGTAVLVGALRGTPPGPGRGTDERAADGPDPGREAGGDGVPHERPSSSVPAAAGPGHGGTDERARRAPEFPPPATAPVRGGGTAAGGAEDTGRGRFGHAPADGAGLRGPASQGPPADTTPVGGSHLGGPGSGDPGAERPSTGATPTDVPRSHSRRSGGAHRAERVGTTPVGGPRAGGRRDDTTPAEGRRPGGACADATSADGAASGGPHADGPPSGSRPADGPRPGRLASWAELLRVSALFTVPGDALAGAAAAGARPDRRTLLAIGTSLCLYEAGMALNDWSDRDEDAVDRPHRPIPSGRISPAAALAAAGALTAAGLAIAARAGRAPLTVATALAAAVWAYDLRLKHTAAGPAAMASARALDLLLGAAATRPRDTAPALRAALPHAGLLAAHTWAVTTVSRHETQGGSTTAPLAALTTTLAITSTTTRHALRTAARGRLPAAGQTTTALTGLAYARTALTPLLHAALNPSPPLTQRAVGAGIRAMIPLQAALAARAGAPGTGLALLGLAPLARRLARKVSPT